MYEEKDKRIIDTKNLDSQIEKIISNLEFHEKLIHYFWDNSTIQKATIERRRNYLRKCAVEIIEKNDEKSNHQ